VSSTSEAVVVRELGEAAAFHPVPGSLSSDQAAEALRDAVQKVLPSIEGVVVSVNAPRERADLMSHTSEALKEAVCTDLITHFTAARAFIPALSGGGVYIGIGGGSADFILAGGAHMSIAQAGLRMLHRALAHELRRTSAELRQLTVASVVNGASTRHAADPAWVTDSEIGEQVAAMLEDPKAFPEPIWRIARRDQSGRPVISHEGPTMANDLPLVASDLKWPQKA
jgi:NAD(P)-dependent dehydrogenase (short-subunit alcohol dehydrogenase family)